MPIIQRPNIILFLLDSLSALDAALPESANGLPSLSKLSLNGACFNRAYTPCPESSPARASLFTGLDPAVHGLWTNGVTLPDYERTFAQRLSQAGYSTYLAGRYQLSGVSRWTTEQARPGEFSQMDWAHGPLHRSRQNAYLEWLQHARPDYHEQIFAVQADPDDTTVTQRQREALAALPDEFSFNHWVGLRVSQWIESQSMDQPFLAVAGFSVGDMLGTKPQPLTDIESVDEPALKQADNAIGQIMEHLEASHRSEDTVIIVAAARGNAGLLTSDKALADHALNETAIRVPLIFHGAAFKPQTVDSLVSTMDIAPTVLAIASVPCGPRMQGESLLGVLDGTRAPRDWGLSRIRQSLRSGEQNWQTALYTQHMKLVVCHGKQQAKSTSMYNLDEDPLENNDLAETDCHASQLEEMMDQMIDARCALEDRTEPRIAEF